MLYPRLESNEIYSHYTVKNKNEWKKKRAGKEAWEGAGEGSDFILSEEWILRVSDISVWVCIKCIQDWTPITFWLFTNVDYLLLIGRNRIATSPIKKDNQDLMSENLRKFLYI